MTKIYIIGLTGKGAMGGYETQLGNVAVLIPMIKLLKNHIPDAKISTTIQLTDKFCVENGVTRVTNPPKFSPRFLRVGLRLLICFVDLFRASLWRFIKAFLHLDLRILRSGKRLEQFTDSDIILDFNGDIFPSDLHPILVFMHALEIVTIRRLGIPVIEFVSSPGPFNTWFRHAISKFMYSKISVLANRDPISSELLGQLGVNKTPIVNTACPAFLLEPAPAGRAEEILAKESIDIRVRPLVGVTLAGYNLSSQRTWSRPKHFDDLYLYVPMMKYLLDDLNANVFLLPHVYRNNPYTYTWEHINGPDYDILWNLFKMSGEDKYQGRFKLIEGKYTSSEAKGIIGQCDLYISGRLHAGVAAQSQAIPTIVLPYGHKHRGFARLLHQEKYVYEGKDPQELKSLVKDAWENREKIARALSEGMVRIEELVNLNFEIVKEVVILSKSERDRIPKELSDAWVNRGYGCKRDSHL